MTRRKTSTEFEPTDAASAENADTTVLPPAAEPVENPQEPQKRAPFPDPFGIATDVLAGIRLFESKRDRQMALKFDEKPNQAVIDKIKENGYRWNSEHQIWAHPVRPDSAMQTRINAEKLYQEVSKMIRAAKGIGAEIAA